jgi:regulator of sigma E protease
MSLTFLLQAILGLGLLVAFHELGHHLAALATGMRVRRFSVGFGPSIVQKRWRGTDYTVGVLPLGGFVDIVGMNPLEDGAMTDPRSYQQRPKWARALVVVAGPVFNYALAWALFVALFALGGLKQDFQYRIREVTQDSAAATAGLQPGDVIAEVNGQAVNRENPLPDLIGAHGGQEVVLRVLRAGEALTIHATPRGDPGRLGVRLEQRPVGPPANYDLLDALALGSRMVVGQTMTILDTVGGWLFKGQKPEVGGPLAIVDELQSAAGRSLREFLLLMAALNVMLGLFNMFPIPPLDGSKLVMLGAEVISRRNIPARLQVYVQGIGMVVMLGLLVIVSIGDFQRFAQGADKPPAEQSSPAAGEPKTP